eukprot:1619950-Rhodomonas_salina.1
MLTVITKLEDSIIGYAAKQPEGAIEKSWSTWIYHTKMAAPGRMLTLDLMESVAPEQERMVEKYTTSKKVQELATFPAAADLDARLSDAEKTELFNALNSVSFGREQSSRTTPLQRDRRSTSPWRGRRDDRGSGNNRFSRTQSPFRGRSPGRGSDQDSYDRSGRSLDCDRGSRDVVCYDCSESGHIAPQCPYSEKYADKLNDFLKELI